MAKITLHVTPMDATELAAITAALAPFVSSGAPAAAETPTPAAAGGAPKPKPKPKRSSPPSTSRQGTKTAQLGPRPRDGADYRTYPA